MPRYKVTIAYDGTNFHGWQKQEPPGQEPLRTVQAIVEQAIEQVVRESVNLTGASRTDSGVHAKGQVGAFSTNREVPVHKLPAAISSRLPDDVHIVDAAEVPPDFSPISDCVAKGYRYRLAYSRGRDRRPPLFDRHYTTWTPYTLDVDRMHEAAQHLLGEHDFASLTRVNHGRESTVRRIDACSVTAIEDDRCIIDVSGNGFLYNMVRIIAGTLLEVGRGQLEPDDIPGILQARDRAKAGPTLPPEGLFLIWIQYPEREAQPEG